MDRGMMFLNALEPRGSRALAWTACFHFTRSTHVAAASVDTRHNTRWAQPIAPPRAKRSRAQESQAPRQRAHWSVCFVSRAHSSPLRTAHRGPNYVEQASLNSLSASASTLGAQDPRAVFRSSFTSCVCAVPNTPLPVAPPHHWCARRLANRYQQPLRYSITLSAPPFGRVQPTWLRLPGVVTARSVGDHLGVNRASCACRTA